MSLLSDELVRQIHAAQGQVVIVLNGGSRAVAELLEVPGGSKTLLEAVVPYSEGALSAWLGSRPEQSCSSRTARAMAVVAFGRAIRYGAAEQRAAGVSCTAGLATDRPKRGPHRAHVAVQSAGRTRHWSLELEKDARRRQEEERIVCRMVLNAVAESCGIAGRLELPLLEQERVEIQGKWWVAHGAKPLIISRPVLDRFAQRTIEQELPCSTYPTMNNLGQVRQAPQARTPTRPAACGGRPPQTIQFRTPATSAIRISGRGWAGRS